MFHHVPSIYLGKEYLPLLTQLRRPLVCQPGSRRSEQTPRVDCLGLGLWFLFAFLPLQNMTPWLRTPTNASRFWMCSVPKPAVPWPVWVVFILGLNICVFRYSPRESDPKKSTAQKLLVTGRWLYFGHLWTPNTWLYVMQDYTCAFCSFMSLRRKTHATILGLQTSVWAAKQHIQVEHIYIYLYIYYINIQWDSSF